MWPSNKDIPLFIRVPVIMNHHVESLKMRSEIMYIFIATES